MRTLIIHPEDNTTLFLKAIYNGLSDIDLITDNKTPNSIIKEAIKSHERIILLGHGTEYGLFSGQNPNTHSFDRIMVDCKHVQLLRNKEIIAIWCNANIFGEKYGLNGLFSGMVISELEESIDCGVQTTQSELDLENIKFAENLRHCLDNYELSAIPSEFIKLNSANTQLTDFNYNSLYML